VTPDVAASVRARLLGQAKRAQAEFELFLVRFACERFLYRLGASALRERCVLKGAGLLMLWMPDPYRATRDVDLLASGSNDEASVRKLVTSICTVPCPDDGLMFDLDSLDISPIRADEEYQGQRVVLQVLLGTARIRLQVDIGFGDAVTPDPEEAEYPTLLPNLPAPRLRAYRRETTIAEKFEAAVTLGRRNSRMKDFHDLWALSSAFVFEGRVLRQAVAATFERRRTVWEAEPPDVLMELFYEDPELQARWHSYLRAAAFRDAPPASFVAVGERVRAFLGPVRDSIVKERALTTQWQAGGPWL
jgi:hypothetical protein